MLLSSLLDPEPPRRRGPTQSMPKPCPRCGLENADEAARCSRCDAPLRGATTITPEFRRFLLWLAAFAVITAIGVSALVWVHRTAVPLGDPVVPPIDRAAQEEAFAREQAMEAPPPGSGSATAPGPGSPPAAMPPQPVAPQARDVDPGTPTDPAGPTTGSDEALAPLLGEEDVTDEMPPVSPAIGWSREILPPTGRPTPQPGTSVLPAPPAGESPAFPESGPAASFPPVAPAAPGTSSVDDTRDGEAASPQGQLAQPGAPPASSEGQAAPADGSAAAGQPGSARSLEEVQRAQCAREGFLTRFVCHERVRLAYCESRWNRHPDCMVDSNATNY